MKPLAMFAATVVTLALLSYTIAIFTEQRKRLVINRVLIFLTLGVLLDISATSMMMSRYPEAGWSWKHWRVILEGHPTMKPT